MHSSVWERSCIRSGKVRAGVAVNNNADHLDRIQRKTLRIIRSLATVSYKEKSKGCKKTWRGDIGEDVNTQPKHEKLLQGGRE